MANVLIYLSASQYNSRVIERGAQIAKLNHASMSAVFVQTAKYENLSVASKRQLQQNIKYAEDKGAKVTILYGQDPIRQLVEYVHVSQVNCVVLEKSLAKQAFSKLDDIDIYSVNYPQDYHRIFHLDLSRFTFSVRDTIKTLFVSCLYIDQQDVYALSVYDYYVHYGLYFRYCDCIYLDKWIYL